MPSGNARNKTAATPTANSTPPPSPKPNPPASEERTSGRGCSKKQNLKDEEDMNKPIDSYYINWHNVLHFPAQSYTCPYCSHLVASNEGYSFEARMDDPSEDTFPDNRWGYICICPNCQNPTIIFEGRQFPSLPHVEPLEHLPEDVCGVYEEARRCMSNGCFTAVVMLCRKIIMNVAVEQGAPKEGDTFQAYVDFLHDRHLFHPLCIPILNQIKKVGNDANHKIKSISHDDAQKVITFTYHVLLYIYEIPGDAPIL